MKRIWLHGAKATEAARTAATQGKKGTATAEQIRDAVAAVGDKLVAPIAPLRFVTDPTAEGLYKLLAMAQPERGASATKAAC